MTDDATFQHGQREERAHAADERATRLARFADNTPGPSRKQQLISKRNSVGLVWTEDAELSAIVLRERFSADEAAERAGEGRLLPAGPVNIHD